MYICVKDSKIQLRKKQPVFYAEIRAVSLNVIQPFIKLMNWLTSYGSEYLGFNAFFGTLVENAGYRLAMLVMPTAAVLVALLLITLKCTSQKARTIR